MRGRLRTVVLLSVVLAAADLVVSQLARHHDAIYDHHRSRAWIALSLSVFVTTSLLTLVPSRLLAFGCGLHAGGTLGNLLWALAHENVVSNSFVLRRGEGGIAFSLADVFVLAGVAVMVAGSIRMTIRHRHRLPQSTLAIRAARRLALAIRR